MWLFLLALACDGGDPDLTDSGVADSGTEEPVLDGEALYVRHCASCHGADGAGTSGPDLADRAQGWTAEQVADVALNGSGFMSGKNVTNDEALAIGVYVVDTLLAP